MSFIRADQFVVGANLPWIGYGTDVGASAWYPSGGFSAQPSRLDLLDRTFAALARDGVPVVRTFLLCDARSGVRFDDAGVALGLDEAALPDVDALVAAARRHGIRLLPVLVDFHLSKPARFVNGVQVGGRARVLTEPASRSAFIDLVIRPIVERYRDEEAVIGWDVMNEPEWCVGGTISAGALRHFLREAVAGVRASSTQPVTIGCAGIDGLDLVRPLGLDFYQVHWYDKFGWPALARPVRELDLGDRPILLGEFPGRSESVIDILDTAQRAGYAGAMVWSVLAEDSQSEYPSELAEWLTNAAGPQRGQI